MSVAYMPRQYTNIEREIFNLEAELRRLKTRTLGWRSQEDYATALKFFDEEVKPKFDAVRSAIELSMEAGD